MMLPLVVCICAPQRMHSYTISVGCLFGSFISLVFGDTTFLMNSIEFLTLFN